MDKPISVLMQKHVTTVDIDDTVDSVEATLVSHKLSCVPVVDSKGVCFGVISSPDLVHLHAIHKKQKTERAWEVCTHKITEVSPDISIKSVAKLMVEKKIHHVIVTENNSIKGIVSSIDLVEEYLLK